MEYTPNYPDILGEITGNLRQNIGVVQAALAMRPFAVRAGHAAEIILLLQNAADTPVEVQVKLHLPESDQKGQRKPFLVKKTYIAIDMKPAEVGYAVLPFNVLPTAALGTGYKVRVELQQKAAARPTRIREAEGGGVVDRAKLTPAALEGIEALAKLRFSADARRNLTSQILETTFNVMPGGITKHLEVAPSWNALWTSADFVDERWVVHKYRIPIKTMLFPKLNRAEMFVPLSNKVHERFAELGFPLQDVETALITKMLVLILEYTAPGDNGHTPQDAGQYDVDHAISFVDGVGDFNAGKWFSGLLRLADRSAKVIQAPEKVIPQYLLPELIYDAIMEGFRLLERATGQDLGTAAEVEHYANRILGILRGQNTEEKLDFAKVYLPLVLAGITIIDKIKRADEHLDETLVSMRHTLAQRRQHFDQPENTELFDMATLLLERATARMGLDAFAKD